MSKTGNPSAQPKKMALNEKDHSFNSTTARHFGLCTVSTASSRLGVAAFRERSRYRAVTSAPSQGSAGRRPLRDLVSLQPLD
jgi:hypothetical protein